MFVLCFDSEPFFWAPASCEFLANNHKSSCMLTHGYKNGNERLSLPQIGAEWNLLLFFTLYYTPGLENQS